MVQPSKKLKSSGSGVLVRLPNEDMKARWTERQDALGVKRDAAKSVAANKKKKQEELYFSGRKKYSSTKQKLTLENIGSSIRMYSTNIEVPNGSKYDLKMRSYEFEEIVDFKTVFFVMKNLDWYRCHLAFVKPKDEVREFDELPEVIQDQIVEMLSLPPNVYKSIEIKSYKGLIEGEQELMETGDVYQTITPLPDLIANIKNEVRSGKVLATFHAWPVNASNFCSAMQIEILRKYVGQQYTSKVRTVDLHNYDDLNDVNRAPKWVHFYYNWAAFFFNFYQVGMALAVGYQEADITCQMDEGVLRKWCDAKSGIFLLDTNENRDSLYVNYKLGMELGSHVYLSFPAAARRHMLKLDMGEDTYITFSQFKSIVSLKKNKNDSVYKAFKKEMMKSGCREVDTVEPEFVPTKNQLALIPSKDRPLKRCTIMITEDQQCKANLQMGNMNMKRAHYRNQHASLKIQCVKCQVVNLFWEEFDDMNNHLDTLHNSDNLFMCKRCECRFKTKGGLKRHEDTGVCKDKEKRPVVLLVVDPRPALQAPVQKSVRPSRRLLSSPDLSEASDDDSGSFNSSNYTPPSPTYSELSIRYPSDFSPTIVPSSSAISTNADSFQSFDEQQEIVKSVLYAMLDRVIEDSI